MAKEDKTSLAVRIFYGLAGHQPSLSGSSASVPRNSFIHPHLGRVDPGLANMAALQHVREQGISSSGTKVACNATLSGALYMLHGRMADLEKTFSVVFGDSDLLERCTLWAMACCGSCPPCMGLPRPTPRVQRQMTSSSTYATTPRTPFSARHATRPFLYPPTIPVPCENSRPERGLSCGLST